MLSYKAHRQREGWGEKEQEALNALTLLALALSDNGKDGLCNSSEWIQADTSQNEETDKGQRLCAISLAKAVVHPRICKIEQVLTVEAFSSLWQDAGKGIRGLPHGGLGQRRLWAPRIFLRVSCAVIDRVLVNAYALDFSTMKAAPGRCPNPRSDDGFLRPCHGLFQSILRFLTHTPKDLWTNDTFFSRINFSLPSGLLLACGR